MQHFFIAGVPPPVLDVKTDDPKTANIRYMRDFVSAGKEMPSSIETWANFCFPDLSYLQPMQPLDLDSGSSATIKALEVVDRFVFVITENGGARLYGFVIRYLPLRDGPRYLEAMCILSNQPNFVMFFSILEHLHVRWILDEDAMFHLLDQVHQGTLNPNEFFQMSQLQLTSCMKTDNNKPFPSLNIERKIMYPFPTRFPFPTICPKHKIEQLGDLFSRISSASLVDLFKYIPLDTVQLLFTALLCEERILVMSEDLSCLSSCLHALVSLLFPFSWPHVFIPILPPALVRFAAAPFPFLLGISPTLLDAVLDLPSSNRLLVYNIDKSSLSVLDEDDTKDSSELFKNPPPKALMRRLTKALSTLGVEKIYSKKTNTTIDPAKRSQWEVDIRTVYLTFFIMLFGDCNWSILKKFSKNSTKGGCVCCEDEGSGKKHNFDKLLNDNNNDNNNNTDLFLKCFIQSQLLEQLFTTQLSLPLSSQYLLKLLQYDKIDIKNSFSKIFSILSKDRTTFNDQELRAKASMQLIFSILSDLTSNQTKNTQNTESMLKVITSGTFETCNLSIYPTIFMIRLRDSKGRNWKHAYKTLSVLDHIIKYGSDRLLSLFAQPNSIILYLQKMVNYRHSNTKVQTQIVNLSFKLLSLLTSLPALRHLRIYEPVKFNSSDYKFLSLNSRVNSTNNLNNNKSIDKEGNKLDNSTSMDILDLTQLLECFQNDNNNEYHEKDQNRNNHDKRTLNPFEVAHINPFETIEEDNNNGDELTQSMDSLWLSDAITDSNKNRNNNENNENNNNYDSIFNADLNQSGTFDFDFPVMEDDSFFKEEEKEEIEQQQKQQENDFDFTGMEDDSFFKEATNENNNNRNTDDAFDIFFASNPVIAQDTTTTTNNNTANDNDTFDFMSM